MKNPIFKIISKITTQENIAAYVVGGYVRDLFLNRSTEEQDIDIVVVGNGIEIARKVAKSINPGVKVSVFKNFGTAMFKYQQSEIEFVGARKESYRKNSRKPIVEDGTLEDDQKRRDFTINAMAFSLNEDSYGSFIDPFNGMADLENKIIRTPLEANRTFSDDPLRMIRAIRFATQLDFTIDEQTLDSITRNSERIKIVSQERIINELQKIILSKKPSKGFKLLEETHLLDIIFPELKNMKGVDTVNGKQHKDNFYHTLEVLDNISLKTDDVWLRWAAILHDIAKPQTKKYIPEIGWSFHGHDYIGAKMVPGIFRRMKLPLNEKMKYVQKIVLLHLRPIALAEDVVSDSALRRLLFDAGEDIEDLMTLSEADVTSKNEKKVKAYLNNFKKVRLKLKKIEEKDAVKNFQPPISGEEIINTFHIKPSKEVGIIKTAIKEAILDGVISNNYDEAYEFMLKKGEELGLTAV
ncbi:MAG: HD domain-containing protein [Bacteroidales bacterium]|nr:HD domain-containing protein [Bacteroidales bacterium]